MAGSELGTSGLTGIYISIENKYASALQSSQNLLSISICSYPGLPDKKRNNAYQSGCRWAAETEVSLEAVYIVGY